jgi:hypothetical protein
MGSYAGISHAQEMTLPGDATTPNEKMLLRN